MAAGLVAGGMTACASPGAESETGTGTSGSTTPTGEATSIKHRFGETSVPAKSGEW